MCQVADESGRVCNACFDHNSSTTAKPACQQAKSASFSTYVLPGKPISAAASKVTGVMVVNGRLHHFGKHVESESTSEAMRKFLTWLEELHGGSILLVGHNCFEFDLPVLHNEMQRWRLMASF